MKLKKLYFPIGIVFSIVTILSSCIGQGSTENAKAPRQQESHEDNKTELDSKATIIYQDEMENYWFASEEKGVYKYDGKSLVLFTSNDGLSNYRILSVQEDHFGNLYFDTPESVFKYDGQKFTPLPVVENQASANEWKSAPGDLWFRMEWDKSGPFRFDGEKLYHLKLPKNIMENEFYSKYPNASYNPYGIYTIYKDSKGNIWIGTANLGIYLFDGKEISWMYEHQMTETPEGGAFGIRSIHEDQDGYYWICNANYKYTMLPNAIEGSGLKSLNLKRHIGIENKEDLYFLSILTDNNGDLWMQTFEQGVWLKNGKKLNQFFIHDDGKNITSTAILKDHQGELWFGTQKDGLFSYNGIAFEKFIPTFEHNH